MRNNQPIEQEVQATTNEAGTSIVPAEHSTADIIHLEPVHAATMAVLSPVSNQSRYLAVVISKKPELMVEHSNIAGRLPCPEQLSFSSNYWRARLSQWVGQTEDDFLEAAKAELARQRVAYEAVDKGIREQIEQLDGNPINQSRLKAIYPGITALAKITKEETEATEREIETQRQEFLSKPQAKASKPSTQAEKSLRPYFDLIRTHLAKRKQEDGVSVDVNPLFQIMWNLHFEYAAIGEKPETIARRKQLLQDRKGLDVGFGESMLLVLSNIAAGNQDFFDPRGQIDDIDPETQQTFDSRNTMAKVRDTLGITFDLTNLQHIEQAHEIACAILGHHRDLEEAYGNGILHKEPFGILGDALGFDNEEELFTQGIVTRLLHARKNLEAIEDYKIHASLLNQAEQAYIAAVSQLSEKDKEEKIAELKNWLRWRKQLIESSSDWGLRKFKPVEAINAVAGLHDYVAPQVVTYQMQKVVDEEYVMEDVHAVRGATALIARVVKQLAQAYGVSGVDMSKRRKQMKGGNDQKAKQELSLWTDHNSHLWDPLEGAELHHHHNE